MISGGADALIKIWSPHAAPGTGLPLCTIGNRQSCGSFGVCHQQSHPEMEEGRRCQWIGHTDAITALCSIESSVGFYSASYDGQLIRWNLPSGTAVVDRLFQLSYDTQYHEKLDRTPDQQPSVHCLASLGPNLVVTGAPDHVRFSHLLCSMRIATDG